MIKRIKSNSLLIIASGLVIFICILFYTVRFTISDFLSRSEKVDANLLVIEGWLPNYNLKMAYQEILSGKYDYIVTTGLNLPDYFELEMNGYLIFYPKIIKNEVSDYFMHIIEIECYSSMSGDHKSHFNYFINDSLAGDLFAEKQKKKYRINWIGALSEIDSILFQFDNDDAGEWGDRNLLIKGVTIDNSIFIPYQLNSEHDIGELDGKNRVTNNATSYSELARNKLIALGVDSDLITAVPALKTNLNRTLASVLAFRDWLGKSDMEIKGINVVSVGKHSGRSWMIYRKVLGPSYKTGIISLPDNLTKDSMIHELFGTMREILGIVYYWLILIPY